MAPCPISTTSVVRTRRWSSVRVTAIAAPSEVVPNASIASAKPTPRSLPSPSSRRRSRSVQSGRAATASSTSTLRRSWYRSCSSASSSPRRRTRLRRNSTGSTPRSWATWSMHCSTQNRTWGMPNPRMEPGERPAAAHRDAAEVPVVEPVRARRGVQRQALDRRGEVLLAAAVEDHLGPDGEEPSGVVVGDLGVHHARMTLGPGGELLGPVDRQPHRDATADERSERSVQREHREVPAAEPAAQRHRAHLDRGGHGVLGEETGDVLCVGGGGLRRHVDGDGDLAADEGLGPSQARVGFQVGRIHARRRGPQPHDGAAQRSCAPAWRSGGWRRCRP